MSVRPASKIHVNTLQLENFVSGYIYTAAALANVQKRILSMSRQVPESHPNGAHRIEFLQNAVINLPWTKELLSRIATAGIAFQQIYVELEVAIQLELASKVISATANTPSTQSFPKNQMSGVNYSSQGRFAHGKSRSPI